MTTTQKLTKADIAKQLVRFDITLSPAQVKKLSLAELEAKLVDAINAEAAKAEQTRAEVAETIHGETRVGDLSIAEAQAMVEDARRADIDAAVASHPITRIQRKGRGKRTDDRSDRLYKTPIDTRDGDGLLTEGACFSRAEDWAIAKDQKHGLPEAGGLWDGEFVATMTDMTQVSVDLKTGKVKKLARIDVDRGSPDVDEPRAPKRTRAAANADASNVVKLPRASKGINIDPKPLGQQKTCRAGTCQALLIDALLGGATLHELRLAAPNWTDASIRSGLAYDVSRIKGYGVRTENMTVADARKGHEASCEGLPDDATIQVYHLVLPAGLEAPLPHVEAAPTKAAANKG